MMFMNGTNKRMGVIRAIAVVDGLGSLAKSLMGEGRSRHMDLFS